MENINQDDKPKAPTISNPKSFVAVTSSERIRKISVVKNDFRPIVENSINHQYDSMEKRKIGEESDSTSTHLPLSSSSSSSSTKRNSKDEFIIEESKSSNNSKRKRKRKSVMKRKNAQRKASGSTTNAVSEAVGSSDQDQIAETAAKAVEKSCLNDSVSIMLF